MRAKGGALYTLSASVNLTVAYERVLIVNLRFIEEAKKARWVRITRCPVFSAVAVKLS